MQVGIARAQRTLQSLKGARIKDHKVVIDNGKISAHRIVMKGTFVLNDGAEIVASRSILTI